MNPDISRFIGKHVLIGITVIDHQEELIEQKQFHGEIIRIDKSIVVLLSSGEEYKLPPDVSALEPAEPGEYHLRSTGEVVVDPDFLTTWTVKKPAPKGDA